MMELTFRPLPRWPYPEQEHRPPLFTASYSNTLERLEREIEALGGSEVIVGVVTSGDQIRLDGRLRADARINHPGVEVSFDVPGRGRLVFHTDVHNQQTRWVGGGHRRDPWRDNLRAIALGLEALRAVDRYGITTGVEQYAGFLMIEDRVTKGRRLVEEAGSLAEALRRWHPDRGGNADAFQAVIAYRDSAALPAVPPSS